MLIENFIKFVELILGIVIVFVWFYGYARTKVTGFALIGFAGVLRFLYSLLLWLLIIFTSVSIRDMFYPFQILAFVVDVAAFFLIVWGILSIIDQLRRGKTQSFTR